MAFAFQPIFESGEDKTEYRALDTPPIEVLKLGGRDVLQVPPQR